MALQLLIGAAYRRIPNSGIYEMILREAGVLLIIGAAVVGPIGPLTKHVSPRPVRII